VLDELIYFFNINKIRRGNDLSSCILKLNMNEHQYFIKEAIRLSQEGMRNNEGGPFDYVIVKDGKIIGKGNNRVLVTNNPTAHVEIVAIRDACANL